MKFNKVIPALMLSALLLGCSEDSSVPPEATLLGNANSDASTSGLGDGSGVNGSGFGSGSGGANGFGGQNGSGHGSGNKMYPNAAIGPEFSDPNNPLSKSIIYFTLDSSDIQPDFEPILAAHARYLAAHPSQRVVLEGHGDERGSREYNIGLGEQRGKTVASKLKLQGTSDSQLDIVSYGEEKPAAFGSDESAWEQNRRVELVYQGR